MGEKIAARIFYISVSAIMGCMGAAVAWCATPALYYAWTGIPILSFDRWGVGLFGIFCVGVGCYIAAKLTEDAAKKEGWDD